MNGRSRQLRSHNGHGGAISFEEEVGSNRVLPRVGQLQSEDPVRDEPDLGAIGKPDVPSEGFSLSLDALWERQFFSGKQPKLTVSATGNFQCHHDLAGEEGVLQEEASDRPIAGSPIGAMGKAQLPCEPAGSFVAEPVGNGLGSTSVEVVDLSPWTFEVAVMEEELETANHVLPTPAEQGDDVR